MLRAVSLALPSRSGESVLNTSRNRYCEVPGHAIMNMLERSRVLHALVSIRPEIYSATKIWYAEFSATDPLRAVREERQFDGTPAAICLETEARRADYRPAGIAA